MLRRTTLMLAILAGPVLAADLPPAIDCYQSSANAKDIVVYMTCFTEDADMINASRVFNGQEAIRPWAACEFIPGGDTIRHREILEQTEGYAKTEADWLS